ncbi:MAG: hypothetical protein HYZ34_10630 [Ignavibacteriae bacterium]|nr:hypothetical protein [Ignavibacteriota bacterium]
MNHIDEHIIELYVLSAKEVQVQTDEIEQHLRECFSCASYAEQLKALYEEAEKNFLQQPELELKQVSALVKAEQEQIFTELPVRYEPENLQLTRWEKVKHFTRKRRKPLAYSSTTLSMLAMVMMLNNYYFKSDKPDSVRLDDASQSMIVMNRANDELWRKTWFGETGLVNSEVTYNISFSTVADLNNDGKKEIISIIPKLFEVNEPKNILSIFDEKGNVVMKNQLGHEVTHRGTHYPVHFETRGLIVGDFGNNGQQEIIVGLFHWNSPYCLLRLNRYGETIGEYWHYGHFWGVHSYDIDDDGNNEIVLCGINDNERKSILVVLDPEKIVGRTESSVNPGFGYRISNAEKHYMMFPRNELDSIYDLKPRVWKIMNYDKKYLNVELGSNDNYKYAMGATLTKNLNVVNVIPYDYTKQLYRSLLNEGKLQIPESTFVVTYIEGVRYWDGKEWKKEPVRVQLSLP